MAVVAQPVLSVQISPAVGRRSFTMSAFVKGCAPCRAVERRAQQPVLLVIIAWHTLLRR